MAATVATSHSSVLGKRKFPNTDEKKATQTNEKETDDSAPILLPLYEPDDESYRRRWVDRLHDAFKLLGKDPCWIVVGYLHRCINRLYIPAICGYNLENYSTAAIRRRKTPGGSVKFRGFHPLSASALRCTVTLTYDDNLSELKDKSTRRSFFQFGIRECFALDPVRLHPINPTDPGKTHPDDYLESGVFVETTDDLVSREQYYFPLYVDGNTHKESSNRTILNCMDLNAVYDGIPVTMEIDTTSLTFTWSIKGVVVASLSPLPRRSSEQSTRDKRLVHYEVCDWIKNGHVYVECYPPPKKISIVTDEAATLSLS